MEVEEDGSQSKSSKYSLERGEGLPLHLLYKNTRYKIADLSKGPSLQIELGRHLRLLGLAVQEDWGGHQTSIPVCIPCPFPSLAHAAVPIPARHSPGEREDDWMKGLTRSPTIYFLRSSCQVWSDS